VKALRAAPIVLAGLALAAALLLAPEAARACAVCTGQDSAAVNRAVLKGTALLSLTPLAVFGGAVWYLRRRARQVAASEAERTEASRSDAAATARSA